ncbi:MAG: peptidase [Actinomycetia bacterium]|nr:peptidase [Actinomycetes bacterium]
MADEFEQRTLVEPVEFRSHGRSLVASGVAMRYGSKSKPIGGQFREVFTPGAFTKTIAEQDVRSHNEHGGPYLGRSGNGSLVLTDTRSELGYELALPDTSAGRDAAVLLERGDIKGSSIGFRAIPAADRWSKDTDGMALRTVGEARLFVVDLVVAPAYDASTSELALRSLERARAAGVIGSGSSHRPSAEFADIQTILTGVVPHRVQASKAWWSA